MTSRTGTSVDARRPTNPTRPASVRASSRERRPARAAWASTTKAKAYPRVNAGVQMSCNTVGTKAPDCPKDGQ